MQAGYWILFYNIGQLQLFFMRPEIHQIYLHSIFRPYMINVYKAPIASELISRLISNYKINYVIAPFPLLGKYPIP